MPLWFLYNSATDCQGGGGGGGRKLVQITLKTLCGALSYSTSTPVLRSIISINRRDSKNIRLV